jgi:hypothetical protein
VWVIDALQRLLALYDSSLPYLISDNAWNGLEHGSNNIYRAFNPSRAWPRCLPCHANLAELSFAAAAMHAVPGCPCNQTTACTPVRPLGSVAARVRLVPDSQCARLALPPLVARRCHGC